MEPIRDPAVLARMQVTLDLFQTAVDIMRQNLRRRHPDASEVEIQQRLQDWMLKRSENGSGASIRSVDSRQRIP